MKDVRDGRPHPPGPPFVRGGKGSLGRAVLPISPTKTPVYQPPLGPVETNFSSAHPWPPPRKRMTSGAESASRTKGFVHPSSFILPALGLILDPLVEGLGGLVEGVLEVVVLGMHERFQRDLLGLGGRARRRRS